MPNPKGGINPQKVNPDEAYNRQNYRAQDFTKDQEDPQVGPVEKRDRVARNRRYRTGS